MTAAIDSLAQQVIHLSLKLDKTRRERDEERARNADLTRCVEEHAASIFRQLYHIQVTGDGTWLHLNSGGKKASIRLESVVRGGIARAAVREVRAALAHPARGDKR